jgi:hypothetical protein
VGLEPRLAKPHRCRPHNLSGEKVLLPSVGAGTLPIHQLSYRRSVHYFFFIATAKWNSTCVAKSFTITSGVATFSLLIHSSMLKPSFFVRKAYCLVCCSSATGAGTSFSKWFSLLKRIRHGFVIHSTWPRPSLARELRLASIKRGLLHLIPPWKVRDALSSHSSSHRRFCLYDDTFRRPGFVNGLSVSD